jgi:phosphatidylinositol alpha-1,6-mannosyltransferase
MTGGIQLLLHRLVQNSRHHFHVVAPAARDADYVPDADAERIRRTPRVGSHRAEVALLGALTAHEALKRRPDLLLSGHLVLGPATLVAARTVGSPAVQYLHAKEITARRALSRAVLGRVPAAIAVSEHTVRLAVAHGANPERLKVIPPGCDPPRSIPPPLHLRSGPATVVTVARLADHYKGFDVMLRALPLIRARVSDARWVVVGDGPLMSWLRATAQSENLADACVFAGRLSDRQRDEWLDLAHVFAMPSRIEGSGSGGSEGFGIVYLEAGSHRLPAVAGLLGGSAEAVVHGVTGLLVDATDHVAVADAICTLLTDRAVASRLGEAGARRAEEHSWRRMANSVDDLLERLVN